MVIDGKALGLQLASVVRAFVTRQVGGITERVAALEALLKEFTSKPPEFDALVRAAVAEAVAALPAPQNGKDADPALVIRAASEAVAALPKPPSVTANDLAPLITQQVKAAVDALPRPADGKSVEPQVVEQLVGQAVSRAVAALPAQSVDSEQLQALVDQAVAAIPPPSNGKDADPELVRQLVAQAVADIPKPQDGKSITVDELSPLVTQEVARAVAELPQPKDGEPGKDVDPDAVRTMVREAVNEIPKPADGKSVTAEDARPIVANEVAKVIALLPKAPSGEDLKRAVADAVAKALAEITLPKDGEPGRDGAHIEILPAIVAEKSYPRGTFAKHEGGLWRAFETTTGMKGWECIVEGVAALQVTPLGERGCCVTVRMSSGAEQRSEFAVPMVIDRGIFRPESAYEKGDGVTYGGSFWIAQKDTPAGRPGEGETDWRLAVKKGRDGKPGEPGKKGEPGKPGRPGRDLTQMGFDGKKH